MPGRALALNRIFSNSKAFSLAWRLHVGPPSETGRGSEGYMSISGVTGSAGLYQALTTTQAKPQDATDPSSLAGSGKWDDAYTLSLGKRGTTDQLLGYNALAKLNRQAEDVFEKLGERQPDVQAPDLKHTLTVTQLAQSQAVSAQAGDSVGPGTLSIQMGHYDQATGTFTPSGGSVDIPIKVGTIDDAVAAINDAKAGVTAKVVTDDKGVKRLEIDGDRTGADNAFSASGLGLAFATTRTAQDALYTLDGTAGSSASNTGVQVAPGLVADLALGTSTLTQKVGLSEASDSANQLVGAFNSLIKGVLSTDGAKSPMAQLISQVAGAGYGAGSLTELGITQAADGSLSLDAAKFQQAYDADPGQVRDLISQVSSALDRAVSGPHGIAGRVGQQLGLLAHSLTRNSQSLLDILNGTESAASDQSSFSSLFGMGTQQAQQDQRQSAQEDAASQISALFGTSA
jgi:flagellar hook-associated protein 2